MAEIYLIEAPDRKFEITSEKERTPEELADWLRKNYKQNRPVTKEEVKNASLPSGITLDVTDGDEVNTFITSRKMGLVPAGNLGQGFELIKRLLEDQKIDDEQAKTLRDSWTDSFSEMLDVGSEDRFKRNALAGFQRSGLGSFRTRARLEGGILQSIMPRTDPGLIGDAATDLSEKQLEKLRNNSDKVFDGALKELRDIAAINTLPDREGVLGKVADFGSMVAGGVLSPENLITVNPAAGAAKSLLARIGQRALYGAAENLAAEAVIQPAVQQARDLRGEDPTWKDVAADFAMSAAGGAALRNAFGAFGDVWRKFKVDPTSNKFQLAVVENISQGDAPIDAMAKAADTTPETLLLELDRSKDPLRSSSDIVFERLNKLKTQVDVDMERANEISAGQRRTGDVILDGQPNQVTPDVIEKFNDFKNGLVPQPEGFTGREYLRNLRPLEEVPSQPSSILIPQRQTPTGEIIPPRYVPAISREPISIFNEELVEQAVRLRNRKGSREAMIAAIDDMDYKSIQDSLIRQDPASLDLLRADLRALELASGDAPAVGQSTALTVVPGEAPAVGPGSSISPAIESAQRIESIPSRENPLRISPLEVRDIAEAPRKLPPDPIEEVNAELVSEGIEPIRVDAYRGEVTLESTKPILDEALLQYNATPKGKKLPATSTIDLLNVATKKFLRDFGLTAAQVDKLKTTSLPQNYEQAAKNLSKTKLRESIANLKYQIKDVEKRFGGASTVKQTLELQSKFDELQIAKYAYESELTARPKGKSVKRLSFYDPDGDEDIITELINFGRPIQYEDEWELSGLPRALRHLFKKGKASDTIYEDFDAVTSEQLKLAGTASDQVIYLVEKASQAWDTRKQMASKLVIDERESKDLARIFLNEGRLKSEKTDTPIDKSLLKEDDIILSNGSFFSIYSKEGDDIIIKGEGSTYPVYNYPIYSDRGIVITSGEDAAETVLRAVNEGKGFKKETLDQSGMKKPEGYVITGKDESAIVIPKDMTPLLLGSNMMDPQTSSILAQSELDARMDMEARGSAETARSVEDPSSFQLERLSESDMLAEGDQIRLRQKIEESKQKIKDLQEQGLIGDSSDVGQGVLFKANEDLFSGISQESGNAKPKPKLEEWADNVIRDNQSNISVNPFLDPSLITAYAVKGMAVAGRAGMKFTEWSREMVKRFGPWIQNNTREIWERMVKFKNNLKEGLVWYRYSYLEPIKDIPGVKNLEDIINLSEPRAAGRLREFSAFILPTIRNSIIAGKKQLKMKEETFRRLSHNYAKAVHSINLNRIHGDGASGLTTKEAQSIIDGYTPIQVAAFKGYTDQIVELNKQILEIARDSGIISNDDYLKFKTIYPNYVPFNRVMDGVEKTDIENLISDGPQPIASGLYRFVGSEKEIADILDSSLNNFEKMIKRSEENIMRYALLQHWRNNKDAYGGIGSFEETKPKIIGTKKIIKNGKEVKVPKYQDVPDDAIQLFENGKRVWFRVKDKDMRDAILSSPFSAVDPSYINMFLSAMRLANATRSAALTTLTPAFAPANHVRDTNQTWLNLNRMMGDVSPALVSLTAENTKSMATIARVEFATMGDTLGGEQLRKLIGKSIEKTVSADDIILYRQFMTDGGSSGGRGTYALKEIEHYLELIQNGMSKKIVVGEAMSMLRTYNMIFEDANRFSTYKLAIRNGFSRRQAAVMSRNATFDPSKVGKWAPVTSAFHMFVGPTTQGVFNDARSLNPVKYKKTFAKTAVGLFSTMGLTYLWNEMVEPGWNDGVGPFLRDFNLSLIRGRSTEIDAEGNEREVVDYYRIPITHSFLPMLYAFNEVYRKIFGYPEKSKSETFTGLADSFVNAFLFVPVGEFSGRPASNIALSPVTTGIEFFIPAFVRPYVDVQANMDWLGRSIVPEMMNRQNANEFVKFNDYMQNSATGQFLIGSSRWIHDNLGMDVSPEVVRYYLSSYLGGVYKTPQQVYDAFGKMVNGEPLNGSDIPILNTFVRQADARAFEQRGEIDKTLKEEAQQYDNQIIDTQRQLRKLAEDAVVRLKKNDEEGIFPSMLRAYNDGLLTNPDGSISLSNFRYLIDKIQIDETNLQRGYMVLRNFRVEDGSRAEAIYGVIERMAPAKRSEFINQLLPEKTIMSEKVAEQLSGIINERGFPEELN